MSETWKASARTKTATRRIGVGTAILTCTGGRSTALRRFSRTRRRSKESKSWKCQSVIRVRRVACAVEKTIVSVSNAACTCARSVMRRSTLTRTGRRTSISISTTQRVTPSLLPIWMGIAVPAGWHSLQSTSMSCPEDSNRRHKW